MIINVKINHVKACNQTYPILIGIAHNVEKKIDRISINTGKTIQHYYFTISTMCFIE